MSLLEHFFKILSLYLEARIRDPEPHQSERLDPDPQPHQSDRQDPDPHLGPHQIDKQDPDPHQSDADPRHC